MEHLERDNNWHIYLSFLTWLQEFMKLNSNKI
jgi:hypothetical protein